MKNLVFLILAVFTMTAYAGFQGYNGTTDLKNFSALQCSTGLTCTKLKDKMVVVSSPTVTGAAITILAANAADGILNIKADNSDDSGDDWAIKSLASDNSLAFQNDTSGSLATKFSISTTGIITMSNGDSISNATDDSFIFASDDSDTTLQVKGFEAKDAILQLWADEGDDAADKWSFMSDHTTNSLFIKNNATTAVTVDSSSNVTVAGTTTSTGVLTATAGIAVSSGLFKNFGRAYDGLTTGTSTTPSATVLYMSQIYIPSNVTLTGIKVNSGATVGTNKYIVALFNSAGTPVANSNLAGVTTANADAYQTIAFTGTYAAVGPGVYWIGLYVNGTTDRFRSIAAGGEGKGLAGSVSAQTFGTVAAVTVPTTFTADLGPVAFTY